MDERIIKSVTRVTDDDNDERKGRTHDHTLQGKPASTRAAASLSPSDSARVTSLPLQSRALGWLADEVAYANVLASRCGSRTTRTKVPRRCRCPKREWRGEVRVGWRSKAPYMPIRHSERFSFVSWEASKERKRETNPMHTMLARLATEEHATLDRKTTVG
jgi:hypothetical protein